jgi:hypothetical protein
VSEERLNQWFRFCRFDPVSTLADQGDVRHIEEQIDTSDRHVIDLSSQ